MYTLPSSRYQLEIQSWAICTTDFVCWRWGKHLPGYFTVNDTDLLSVSADSLAPANQQPLSQVSLPYILNPKYHTRGPDCFFVYLCNLVARPTLPVSAFLSPRLPQPCLRLWALSDFSRFQTLLWSSPKHDDQTHHSNNPTSGTKFCFNSVSVAVTKRNLWEEKVNFIFYFWVTVLHWSQNRSLRQEPRAEAIG